MRLTRGYHPKETRTPQGKCRTEEVTHGSDGLHGLLWQRGRWAGVGVWRLDGATGALHHVQTAPVNSPSFVARHQNGRFLYAVCERDGFQGTPDGAVASFAINSHDGTLTEIGKVRSHGTSACHLTVDPSGTHVIVTNYGNGRVAVFPIGADGALGEATHVVQHEGRSTHPDRQHGRTRIT